MEKYADELSDARLLPSDGEDWKARLHQQTDLQDVPADCDLAIEAITEDVNEKQSLIARIGELCSGAVLASSTSGLPADDLAAGCADPSRFVVMHFANPPHLMPLVEIVPGSLTSSDTMEFALSAAKSLGKSSVSLTKDVPGHLFNRIQFAMLREAMDLVERGIAEPRQIDLVVKQGLALRLAAEGPLEKIDLASLQLVHDVAAYIYPTLCNTESPGILARMLRAGKEGARSGQGFYEWTDEKEQEVLAERNAEVIRHLHRLEHEA